MLKILILGWGLSFSLFAKNSINFNPDRILVKVRDVKVVKSLKNKIRYKNLFENWYVLHTQNHDALIKELEITEDIITFEKDYKAEKKFLPHIVEMSTINKQSSSKNENYFNDPEVSKVWSFEDKTKNGSSIYKAYQSPFPPSSQEIIVAVVDTGVDFNHEDLRDVMWINKNEIPDNNIDDDNNGYIDDIHGINTLKRDRNGNATGKINDTHSHGTHVSGTIGATQNNNIGIAGIASNVKIMGIRTVPNSGDELDVDVVESFLYAAKNGAKIINCSFGKKRNEGGQAVKEAIDFIGKEYGTLVIAAAGNDSKDIDLRLSYPASFKSSNLMVIASTTSRGGLSFFSNFGKKNVDLAAPGSSIYSLTPGNKYGWMSGTSMASPTAAGIAAEVWSRFPSLSLLELKEVLMKTVIKSRKINRAMVSQGRIDLYSALKFLD